MVPNPKMSSTHGSIELRVGLRAELRQSFEQSFEQSLEQSLWGRAVRLFSILLTEIRIGQVDEMVGEGLGIMSA